MVTNRAVLGHVADKWTKEGLFKSRESNLIGWWCVRHYRKYGKPPGRQIESIFDRWAEGREGRDEDQARIVEKLLKEVSAEYERGKKTQVAHVLDMAGEYFTKARAELTIAGVEQLLEDGKVSDAVSLIQSFNKVEVGKDVTIRILEDKEAIRRAFESKSEPLVRYTGALGAFFGDAIERESFISAEGPEKRGKSTILLDMAWVAMEQGRRVCMFQCGDLSQDQIMRRFMTRASGRPLKANPEAGAGAVPVLIPTALTPPAGRSTLAEVAHRRVYYEEPLTWKQAWKKSQKVIGRSGADLLRLRCYPTGTVSVTGLNAAMDQWERTDGWVPDIVIIDYIDLLAPMNDKEESRQQVIRTWKSLSAMRQTRRCAVIGATQTNAESYDAEVLGMKHFSESKAKRAEVTGAFGLNQTEEEKALGLYRFNWFAGRDWAYDSQRCVHVAGCAALMQPCMLSVFGPTDNGRGKRVSRDA